jgi:hypothetical protein
MTVGPVLEAQGKSTGSTAPWLYAESVLFLHYIVGFYYTIALQLWTYLIDDGVDESLGLFAPKIPCGSDTG